MFPGKHEDRRFKTARFEAICSLVLTALYFMWWYGFAYHGTDSGPEGYHYFMGLPGWFFFSCVLGPFLFCFIAWAMVNLLFKEVSLSPKEEDDGKN